MSETEYINTVTKVLEALDEIRPFLDRDGGDIELIDVAENVVTVRLLGNCSACAISTSTMRLGVENIIKQYAPEITEVVNIE